jgi:hypothetical protein
MIVEAPQDMLENPPVDIYEHDDEGDEFFDVSEQ